MASRLARTAIGASRLRPTVPMRSALPPSVTPLVTSRFQSSVPSEDPKSKAQSILDSIPGQSMASKTAILSGTTGLSVWAISNELYVVNEESIILFSMLAVFWSIWKYGGPMYRQWAEGHSEKVKNILNSAREDHVNAVKSRIDSVKDLSGVVDITKNLFEVSKETARLEAEAYELEQKTAVAAEAKNTLDSWVRYEGQVRAQQQKELADTVISKVEKELENPKVLKQILDQSISEVERLVSSKSGGGAAASASSQAPKQ